jgi:hypothetical protein
MSEGHEIISNLQSVLNLENPDKPQGVYNGNPIYINDEPIYRHDQVGVIKPLQEDPRELIEETPVKDRRFINPSTVVERDDKYGRGFLTGEIIAVRVLNEQEKWITKNGLKPYITLTPLEYFYNKKGGGKVSMTIEPGKKFWAPKNGENNEKRNIMLKEATRKK